MAKGESGRIVLEVEPELKKSSLPVLAMEKKLLKTGLLIRLKTYM